MSDRLWLAVALTAGLLLGYTTGWTAGASETGRMEADARAAVYRGALAVTAATLDTLTTTCEDVMGEYIELTRLTNAPAFGLSAGVGP